MSLPTNIAAGYPDHPGLHNKANTKVNAVTGLVPRVNASMNVEAIRAIIEAARYSTNGATIHIDAGTFDINDTIEFRNLSGLRFIGSGGATVFRWTGNNANKPVFKLAHCHHCYLADFQIKIDSLAYAGIQQLRDNVAPSNVTPMRNEYQRVDIYCNNAAATGFMVGGTGMVDANNDFGLFDNCRAQDYTAQAWFLGGSQSYGNEMRHCYAFTAFNGQYAVLAYTQNGHFNWYGGFVGGHSKADFYIGRSYQPYLIEGVNGENSARLLEVPNGVYRQVTLRSVRWAGNMLHADRKAIITSGRSNLLMEHCVLGDGSSNAPLTLEFIGSLDGTTGSLVMIGNRIYSTAANVFTNDVPGMMYGNSKITDEALVTTEPLVA